MKNAAVKKGHKYAARPAQVEEALRESEQPIRALVELTPDAIITLNLKGVVTSCNPAWKKLSGYTSEEIVGKHISKLPTADVRDIPVYLKIFSSLLTKKKFEPIEIPWTHKDGTRRLAEFYITLIRKNGKKEGFLVIGKDITERKRVEEEVREFKLIADSAAYGVAIGSVDGILTYVNQSFAQMHGYSPDELVGRHFSILYTEEQMPIIQKLRDQLMQTGSFAGEEMWHRRRDGTVFPTMMTGNLMRDEKGNPSYLVGTTLDITERKQVEEEAREFKLIADSAAYGVAIGSVDGILTYVNQSFAQMHGYTPDELVGRHFSILYTEEQMPIIQKLRDQLMQTGSFAGEEMWHRRKDGTVFPTIMTGNLMRDEEGNPSYLVGTTVDITERKRVEDDIRKFKTITDGANYGIAMISSNEGKFIYTNEVFATMCGYTPDQLTGSHYSILFTEEQFKDAVTVRNQLLSAGGSVTIELWRKRADGTVFPTLTRSILVNDDKGKPLYVAATVIDITERKQMEEALLENTKHYATASRLANLGYWDRDFIMNMAHWSNEVHSIFGVDPEEFHPTWENFLRLVHPADREQLSNNVRVSQESGEPLDVEYRIKRPDGIERVVHSLSEVRYDEKGKPVGLIGSLQDITERKKAEEEIQSTRDYLENLNNSLPEVIINVKHPERIIKYVNRTMETVFGYTPEECIGKNIEFLFSDREEYLRAGKEFQNAHESGEPYIRRECLYRRKNGEVFLTEVTVALVSEKGKITGRVGVISDITERKKAEEALQLRAHLLNHATDSVIAAGLEGNLLYVNDTACRTYGYAREEMLEMNLRDVVTPKHSHSVSGRIKKVIDEGHVSFESEHKRRDGSAFPVEITSRLITLSEKTVILSAMRDITERKRAEAALQESEGKYRAIFE